MRHEEWIYFVSDNTPETERTPNIAGVNKINVPYLFKFMSF